MNFVYGSGMVSVYFCKFHGFGNDYIVIESASLELGSSRSDLAVGIGAYVENDSSLANIARGLCHRHFGPGADGIAVIENLDGDMADYNCRIINPDGSEAAFSGNGTRSAVAYLYYKKLWTQPTMRLETDSGVKNYTLIERMSDGHYWFEAEIGKPKFASDEIPVRAESRMENVIDRRYLSVMNGSRYERSMSEIRSLVCLSTISILNCVFGTKARVSRGVSRTGKYCLFKGLDRENIELPHLGTRRG